MRRTASLDPDSACWHLFVGAWIAGTAALRVHAQELSLRELAGAVAVRLSFAADWIGIVVN